MSVYDELSEKINKLRAENLKPKYMILGYGKVRELEENLSPEPFRLDCSTEEFMKRGAAGKFHGCEFFIDQVKEYKVTILTEKEVEMLKSEINYKERNEG